MKGEADAQHYERGLANGGTTYPLSRLNDESAVAIDQLSDPDQAAIGSSK